MQVLPHPAIPQHDMPPIPLDDMHPDRFSALADTGCLEVCDDENGNLALQAIERTLSDLLLYALSYVPIINQWKPISAFIEDIKDKNADVLELFLQSLSTHSYILQDENAVRHLENAARQILDRAGATPLQRHVFDQLINVARAEPQMCGFSNLGNTCYANTGLKFLVHSIGKDSLLKHLEELKNTSPDEIKKESAEKFITLINAAYGSDEPIQDELEALFNSLQRHPNFSKQNFTIIGKQNDTQEFLVKLSECFDLDSLNESPLMMQTTLINGEQKRDPKISAPNFATDVNLASNEDANLDLQGIMNKILTSETEREIRWNDDDSENTYVKVQNEWATSDVHKLKRFNLHINALGFNRETSKEERLFLKADFTTPVTITVIEKERGGTQWQLTLEPKDIIVHDSRLSHYYMYTRDNQNAWIEHNDADVTSDLKALPVGTQAKMISFEVTNRKIIDNGPRTLLPLNVPSRPQSTIMPRA